MCDSFWTSLEFLFVFIFILLMSRYPCSLCAFVFFSLYEAYLSFMFL